MDRRAAYNFELNGLRARRLTPDAADITQYNSSVYLFNPVGRVISAKRNTAVRPLRLGGTPITLRIDIIHTYYIVIFTRRRSSSLRGRDR